MKKFNNKKGISLIVLVITIIVMIILATAIILSLSSSGIIDRTNEAKKSSDFANKKEAAAMKLAEYDLAKQMGTLEPDIKNFNDFVKSELEKDGIDTSDLIITNSGEILVGLSKNDVQVQTDFLESKTKYLFMNGFLTGIGYVKEGEYIDEEGTYYDSILTETVEEVEAKLPEDYEIWSLVDGEEVKANATSNVASGMILKKEGKEVGKIVVFGDVQNDGANDYWYFDTVDVHNISYTAKNKRFLNSIKENWQIVAMDVNHDNVIDEKDKELISEENLWQSSLISQDAYAPNPEELKAELASRLEE